MLEFSRDSDERHSKSIKLTYLWRKTRVTSKQLGKSTIVLLIVVLLLAGFTSYQYSEISSLQAEDNSLVAANAGLGSTITSLKANFTVLQSGITSLQSTISALRSKLALLNATFSLYNPDLSNLAWQADWGGQRSSGAASVAVATDGSVYVTGQTSSFGAGGWDAFILKYSSEGQLIWQRTWGGIGDDYGERAAVSVDGNVYVAGFTDSFRSTGEVFLLKFSPDGSLIWQTAYFVIDGTVYSFPYVGLSAGTDGSMYVTATTSAGATVLKFNRDGNLIWHRAWRGTRSQAAAVAIGPDGGVYVASNTLAQNSHLGIILFKLQQNGTFVWEKGWASTADIYMEGIGVANDGGVYLAGMMLNGAISDTLPNLELILKVSPSGSLVWQKSWGVSEPGSGSYASDVAVSPLGAVYVVGLDVYQNGAKDMTILKFTSTGQLIAQEMWGGAHSAGASGVTVGPEGSLFVAGDAGGPSLNFTALSRAVTSPGLQPFSPIGGQQTESGMLETPNGVLGTPDGYTSYPGHLDAEVLKIKGS